MSVEWSGKPLVWRAHMRTWGPDARWWWQVPGDVWGTSATWRGAMNDLCEYLRSKA